MGGVAGSVSDGNERHGLNQFHLVSTMASAIVN